MRHLKTSNDSVSDSATVTVVYCLFLSDADLTTRPQAECMINMYLYFCLQFPSLPLVAAKSYTLDL